MLYALSCVWVETMPRCVLEQARQRGLTTPVNRCSRSDIDALLIDNRWGDVGDDNLGPS